MNNAHSLANYNYSSPYLFLSLSMSGVLVVPAAFFLDNTVLTIHAFPAYSAYTEYIGKTTQSAESSRDVHTFREITFSSTTRAHIQRMVCCVCVCMVECAWKWCFPPFSRWCDFVASPTINVQRLLPVSRVRSLTSTCNLSSIERAAVTDTKYTNFPTPFLWLKVWNKMCVCVRVLYRNLQWKWKCFSIVNIKMLHVCACIINAFVQCVCVLLNWFFLLGLLWSCWIACQNWFNNVYVKYSLIDNFSNRIVICIIQLSCISPSHPIFLHAYVRCRDVMLVWFASAWKRLWLNSDCCRMFTRLGSVA